MSARSSASVPASSEVRDEAYFRSKPFEWCWLKFNVVVPADKHPRLLLNRYPHNVIGAGAVVFGRCWGVNWKQSQGTRRRKSCAGCEGRGWNWRDTPEGEVLVPCPRSCRWSKQ